jgi:hypothetical protein
MGSSSGEQISIPGDINKLTITSGCGVLTTSSLSPSSIAISNGSYVVLDLNPNLTSAWMLTA